MKNDDVILAELEALKTRVAALETKTGLVKPAAQDVAPAKFVERGVSITHHLESCPIALPTEAEHRTILQVVFRHFPKFEPNSTGRWASAADEFFRDYLAAFEAVSHFRRLTGETNKKYAIGWWTDHVCKWQSARGNSLGSLPGPAFLAAVLGAGDILYTPANEWGEVWTVGLDPYIGRPSTEAWRNVVQGKLLAPLRGKFSDPPAPARVDVRAG
jgi:hypothetical protein